MELEVFGISGDGIFVAGCLADLFDCLGVLVPSKKDEGETPGPSCIPKYFDLRRRLVPFRKENRTPY